MKKRTKESTSQDVVLNRPRKCYDCNEYIYNIVDLVSRPVVISVKGGKKDTVDRHFHIDCLKKFNVRCQDNEYSVMEDTDWDKVYQFFQHKYLKVSSDMMSYPVLRLKGLRVNKFSASGINVKFHNQGYSYDIIYKAMVFAYPNAIALASTTKFRDFKHKVNFFIKLIHNELANVQFKVDELNRANEATANAVVKGEKFFDHKAVYEEARKLQLEEEEKNKSKFADMTLEEIIGRKEEEDDEFEW